MSLSDEQIARIAGWNDQFEASDWHETAIELARELQSLRASRRPDMSDEAVQAARWLLDFLVPAGSHIGPVDEKALVVARALLAREAERDATIEACAAVVEWIYDNGLQGVHAGEQCIRTAKAIRALKTAGQPSADGGKEGK